MSRVLMRNRSLFLACLLVLGVLLLLPGGSEVAAAKKPPKRTPTPAPAPDHDPDLAYVLQGRTGNNWHKSIYTVNLDGSNKHLFVDCGLNDCIEPTWSPDGSMLAFTAKGGFEGPGVYVINSDGTGLRRVAENSHIPWRSRLAWSPGPVNGDGIWIAYANQLVEPWAVFVVEVQQPEEPMNEPIPLVEPDSDEDPLISPSWSADGQFLIVTAAVDNGRGWPYEIVYGFDQTQDEPTVLPERNEGAISDPPPCPLYGPRFSPLYGDNRIVIAGCNQTYLVEFDNNDPLNNPGYVVYPHLSEFITDHNVDDPEWSPDGMHFTFGGRTSHASWGIFTMPLDPYATPLEVVREHGNRIVGNPAWRPR